MIRSHKTFLEGSSIGLLSAAVVIVWLLVMDMSMGYAFQTMAQIGHGVIETLRILGSEVRGRTPTLTSPPVALRLIGFALLHVVLWCAYGVAWVGVAHWAAKTPTILLGGLLLLVLLQLGFVVLVGLLVQLGLGPGGWVRLLGGNLLGTALIAFWVSRTHPLGEEFRRAGEDQE